MSGIRPRLEVASVTADDGLLWRVSLLGPVRAWRGDAEVELGAPQRRAVLGLLAARANQVVSRDELIDGIWGEELPSGPVNALHVHVARLRMALEPDRARRAPSRVLLASKLGYLLRLAPGQLDAAVFAQTLAAARELREAGDLAGAAGSFNAALQLWQGDALAGIPGPWAEIIRAGLGEQRLTATEEHIETILALGRHAEAVPQLMELVRVHPLRERFSGQLMLALYRCGRQAEALTTFAAARRVLVGELGIEPGPRLRELHAQILAADPDLDLAAEGGTARVSPGPEQKRLVSAQLPGDVTAFTGRADELAGLDLLLAETSGSTSQHSHQSTAAVIAVVSGTAGVGKTALAVHWARQAAGAFPDGQLYVNLRGYDPGQPVLPADALAGFLRGLGVAGQDIPPGEDERAAAYRSLLNGRRVLVVLDNAGSVEQVRPLLPGCPSCLVVVTSRDSLAGLVARHGARRLNLDILPPDDALGLLRTLIGARVDAEPLAAAALAAQCARLPLALRVAAELAAANSGSRLDELASELADEQRRLDLLDAGGDGRTAVRGVFSWSYRHLPADAARAFRLAGLYLGPHFDAYAIAAMTAVTATQARDVLALLARAHLVHPAGTGRYGMHDLLRAYAGQLAAAQDSAAARDAALTSLYDYYLGTAASAMDTLVPAERHYRPHVPPVRTPAPPVASPDEARGWLDAERATLVAMAVHAATQTSPGHATRLAAIMYRYLETGGHYADAVTMHSHARHAACLLGDRAAEATALTNLGIISWRQGRYRQAADYHQQALAVSVEIADRMGEAIAVANLGAVYERQGRYERAAGCHQQALALFRETGDRSGEARALGNLGSVAGRQGRYEQAVSWYQQALAVFRESGDQVGEASALPDLGVTYQRQGRYEQAFGCYHQALALFRVSGDRTGEAEARNGLGEILLSTGRPDEARVEHTAALTLASQIGDRYEQARAHSGLGAALGVIGDAGLAQQHRQRALDLYSELGAAEAEDTSARRAAMDHGDPNDLAHGDLVGLLLPGDRQLAQQAFQRPDGPAELLRPAEPAELAGLSQVRLQRGVPGKARGREGGQRLAYLTVALTGRHHLARRGQRILDLEVDQVRPEQLVAVGVRPDAALHEVGRVEGGPQGRRADADDQVRAPLGDVAVDLLLVLVRQHDPALRRDQGQRAHPVDDFLPVAFRRLTRRDEEREDPHDRGAEQPGDIRDAAHPLQFGPDRRIDRDLADRGADSRHAHPRLLDLPPELGERRVGQAGDVG
jgi:DNA-binding SARP family transcriptional activator/tetratricopeptide (TPR) repeat protein